MLNVGSRFAVAQVDPVATISCEAAFTEQHPLDYHAWPYLHYDDNGELAVPQYRLPNKDYPGVVLCNYLFFDYDSDKQTHEEILELLSRIPADHYLYRPCCVYRTKGGVRLVYQLDEPLLPEDYREAVRGMAMDLWAQTTLQVDPSTDQWWRCFRLPMVTRDDDKAKGPTWLTDYFTPPVFNGTVTVSPEELPRRKAKLPWDRKKAMSATAGIRPDNDTDLEEGRRILYRKAMRSSHYRDYIFDLIPIPVGRRDLTLLAIAGETVSRSFKGVLGATAAEVFCLLMPIAMGMDDSDANEPWGDKLWRMVQHSWQQESAKEEQKKEKAEAELTARERVMMAMEKSLPPGSDLQRHLCLQTPTGAYVVTADGTFTRSQLRTSQLPAHFNAGLSFLAPCGFRTDRGSPLNGQQILNEYATNIDSVEYVAAGTAHSTLVKQGDRLVLQVAPFALRRDLVETAQLDMDIDGWLDTFPDPVLLRRWIAASLAIHHGGIASLYLYGPARVGKTMLAAAIAECFHCNPVPAAAAFSEFNGALLDSPVVMVDEGLPVRTTGTDTADLFRSLVTGGPVSAMRKHRDAVVSKIPYRLIFAANSYDMVQQLIGKRTMSPQDRDAFRERILVMETGVKPAEFLDSRGAMNFTRYHAKGSWLGKECRLARHFIKLYQMAFVDGEFQRSGRLLVEGQQHPAFTKTFDLSGSGRDVVDELVDDITKLASGKINDVFLRKCLEISPTGVWIKKRPYVKRVCRASGYRMDAFNMALDRFLTGKTRHCPMDQILQMQVDIEKLLFCASGEGLDVSPLTALKRQAQGIV